MKLSEKLKLVAEWLASEDNDLLVSAEEDDGELEKYAQQPGEIGVPIGYQTDMGGQAPGFRAPHNMDPEDATPASAKPGDPGFMGPTQGKPPAPQRPQAAKPQANYGSAEWQAHITQVQQLLKQWGFDPGVIDGKLGPMTSAALKKLQTSIGFSPNGSLDDATDAYIKKFITPQAQLNTPPEGWRTANQKRAPLIIVAEALVKASEILQASAEEVKALEPTDTADVQNAIETLDNVAVLAEALDGSEDAWLQKQASVLDAVLEMFAAKDTESTKKAGEDKIDQLKKKYVQVKEHHDKLSHISEAVKDIEKAPMYKQYRPLQTELSMRVCPDHFCQIARIGEDKFQCVLDKRIYDYREGFTLLNGNKVPGTSISDQTQHLNEFGNAVFDTRGDRTGQNND